MKLSKRESNQLVAEGLKVTDTGMYYIGQSTLNDTFKVARAACSLHADSMVLNNHFNWVVGDIMSNCSKKFGDKWDQDADSLGDIIRMDYRELNNRRYTSEAFPDKRLRKHSYDQEGWEIAYGPDTGETYPDPFFPIAWKYYDTIRARTEQGDLGNQTNLIRLAHILGISVSGIRKAWKAIQEHAPESPTQELNDLVSLAETDPVEASIKLDELHELRKYDKFAGHYLLIGLDESGIPRHRRVADIEPQDVEDYKMVIKATSRNLYEVKGIEEGKERLVEIPTEED